MIHTHFKLDLECGQGHKCLHIMLLRKWGHIPFYSECNSSVFGWVHTCIYVQLPSCDQITEKAFSGQV